MTRVESIPVEGALILGAGLAGLFAALKLSPRPVTVLSPDPLGSGASSAWAQAGIAAAVGTDDTPELHAEDTVAVGAGLVDDTLALEVAKEAASRLEDLARLGVRFDRTRDGRFVLSKEAGHRAARVAGTGFDGAGQEIMRALSVAARETPSVRIIEGAVAHSLAIRDGHVIGAHACLSDGTPILLLARSTILASGGLCGLYRVCTSPPRLRGQALAMAARAGAAIADAEFVQFHPTAIDVGRDPTPLASESLRGAGAVLIDGDGRRFMIGQHPDAELAPRDVVARAIFRVRADGRSAFLDSRPVFARNPDAFPNVALSCRSAGIDPARDPIPVTPAAHFHIGGVRTDRDGKTSVPGLFACGEAAATGLHGGNRLGSNSLLEACVFASRIARQVAGLPGAPPTRPTGLEEAPPLGPPPDSNGVRTLRRLMSAQVGVVRDEEGLTGALRQVAALHRATDSRSFKAMADSATLIAAAAIRRRESRGAHFRSDYPNAVEACASRSEITLNEAERIRAEAEK